LIKSDIEIELEARDKIADYYFDRWFGMHTRPTVDKDIGRGMALACRAIANGDGEISELERKYMEGFFYTTGMSTADVVNWMNSPALTVEESLESFTGFSKALIYHAAVIASADGLDELEKRELDKVALKLGISQEEYEAILSLIEEEEALKVKRIAVLGIGPHRMMKKQYSERKIE
jgi:tellurite resistance protein